MNHPPIPDFCPLFSKLCLGLFSLNVYLLPDGQPGRTRIDIDLKNCDPAERVIVGSVAHCAWTEWARARPKATCVLVDEGCDYEWNDHGAGDARDTAWQWLLWARGAEWVGRRDGETKRW